MKIVLIGNHDGVFPTEISRKLRERGFIISHVDFVSLKIETVSGINDDYANALKSSVISGKLKSIVRLRLLEKIIKDNNADIVHFHYARWFYFMLVPTIKMLGKPVAVTVYGSDFYRISGWKRLLQRRFFHALDAVTFTNEATMQALIREVPVLESKCQITRFGLTPLEAIDRYRGASAKRMRDVLGLPTFPITVCCGYNANPGQQHLAMIDALGRLPAALKTKILFVFPMSYGGTEEYIDKVKEALRDSGLAYHVLEAFMRDEKIAALRLLPDIMINMLVTDQFSGSMQEHLYAGNCVIAGGWLPYETLEAQGARILRPGAFVELPEVLATAVNTLQACKESAPGNARAVAALSSWSATIGAWESLYDSLIEVKK